MPQRAAKQHAVTQQAVHMQVVHIKCAALALPMSTTRSVVRPSKNPFFLRVTNARPCTLAKIELSETSCSSSRETIRTPGSAHHIGIKGPLRHRMFSAFTHVTLAKPGEW